MVLYYNNIFLITVLLNIFVDVITKLFANETLITYSGFESFETSFQLYSCYHLICG